MGKLTEAHCRSARSDGQRPRMIGDGAGLWLRVYPTGHKVWIVRRKVRGHEHQTRVGEYPDTSLKQARDAAHDRRKQSSSVAVPRSVAELADAFYATEIEPHYRRPERIRRYLDRDLTTIRSMRVADVTRAHLAEVLAAKRHDGRVAANRLMAITKRMFRHAMKIGWIDADPSSLLDRSVAGGKEKPRERVLSDDEIRKLWAATADDSGTPKGPQHTHGPLLRFLLITGQRIAETQSAQWADIDLKKRIWTVPAANTKSQRAHWVALPKMAIDILKSLPRDGDHVFPRKTATGVQSYLRRWCEREGIDPAFRPHDLRRSCATRMSDAGVTPHIVERTLNHAMQGVMAIYNRSEFRQERIEGAETWARALTKLLKSSPSANRQATSKAPKTR